VVFMQRRRVSSANDAAPKTIYQTFRALHLPGMQPHSTTFFGLLGCGQPAERDFERFVQEPATIDDTCPSLLGWSPKDVVILSCLSFAFSLGPSAQVLGFMSSAHTGVCE